MVNAVLILALMAPAASPDAILLETRVDEKKAIPVADDVDTFIGERMQEAWGIQVLREDPGSQTGRMFRVDLHWTAPDEVNIKIAEPGELYVDRSVPINDRSAARALVWLMVRSTIERVVLRSEPQEDHTHEAPSVPVAPAPAAEPEVAPVAEATPAIARLPAPVLAPEIPQPELSETATLAAAPEAVETEATEAADQPAEIPSATMRQSVNGELSVTDLARNNYDQLSATASAPVNMGSFSGLSVGLMARAYYDLGETPVQGSPNVQVRLRNANWVFGGEIGYRNEDIGLANSHLSHVPLTLMGGYHLGSGFELGVTATADFKYAELNDDQGSVSGMALSLLAGAYARGSWDIYESSTYELAIVADVNFSPYLLRQRYVAATTTYEEGPFLVGGGVGVEMRWR